jgi:hypothetical protein
MVIGPTLLQVWIFSRSLLFLVFLRRHVSLLRNYQTFASLTVLGINSELQQATGLDGETQSL